MRSLMYSRTYAVRPWVAGTLLLMTLYGTACQAWHTERIAPESLLAAREPAELRITTTDGSQIVVGQPVLRGDTLVGTRHHQDQQQEVRVPLTDVRAVATRGFSAGRTLGLTLGLATVAVGTVVIVFLINCPGSSACS